MGEGRFDGIRRLGGGATSFVSESPADAANKLSERDMPAATIRTALEGLGLDVYPFDMDMAYSAGILRAATRGLGLSLGDRACLALGLMLSVPVFTADRRWKKLNIGLKIRVIR